jgi:hypothetical protein
LVEVTEGFAPAGVAHPWAWNALVVVSLANLLVAAAAGLIVGGLAYANVMRQPERYQSEAVMLIDQPLQLTAGDAGVVIKLNQLRAKYAALITTSEIIEPAAAAAKLPESIVRAAQRPLVPSETLTLMPAARAATAEMAQTIAQATALTLQNYVEDEQAATGLNAAQRLSLRIVQDAGSGVKVEPSTSRARQVGVVAAGAAVLLAYVGLQLAGAARRH